MALLGNDPLNAVHLNIPSVNAPVMPGRLTTTRSATNVTSRPQQYTIEAAAPDGSTISVSPDRFNAPAGQSRDFTITIQSTAEGQQFGEIRLIPRDGSQPTLHMPVAFVPQQGAVSLTSACVPSTILERDQSTCTITAQNDLFEATTVDLSTPVNDNLSIVSADAGSVRSRTVNWSTELAAAQLGVPAVAPGVSPAGPNFLPMRTFFAARSIGDEAIVNYTVPAFTYAGKTSTSIGVDSNGYLVVGGGTSEDNDCCNNVRIPDPTRPNNILAPFWTDLDGTGAPGIRVGVLGGGGNSWIVVELEVNDFGTTTTRRFQTWIGVSGDASPVEDVTFDYDLPTCPASPSARTWPSARRTRSARAQVSPPTPHRRRTCASPARRRCLAGRRR